MQRRDFLVALGAIGSLSNTSCAAVIAAENLGDQKDTSLLAWEVVVNNSGSLREAIESEGEILFFGDPQATVCCDRAQVMSVLLTREGITHAKIFAYSVDFDDKAIGATNGTCSENWNYHVALIVPKLGSSEAGAVIDPSLTCAPVSIGKWVSAFLLSGYSDSDVIVEIQPSSSYQPKDPKGGFIFEKEGDFSSLIYEENPPLEDVYKKLLRDSVGFVSYQNNSLFCPTPRPACQDRD